MVGLPRKGDGFDVAAEKRRHLVRHVLVPRLRNLEAANGDRLGGSMRVTPYVPQEVLEFTNRLDRLDGADPGLVVHREGDDRQLHQVERLEGAPWLPRLGPLGEFLHPVADREAVERARLE